MKIKKQKTKYFLSTGIKLKASFKSQELVTTRESDTVNFRTHVVCAVFSLPGVIHGDLNEGNILVSEKPDQPGLYNLCGVLDFGDLVDEFVVFEVSIAMTYIMLESNHGLDPMEAGGHVLAGYISKMPLPPVDCCVLQECIAARLAQSLTYGAYAHQQDATNTYCLQTSKTGWALLRRFWATPKHTVYQTWRAILKQYDLTANF